MQAAPVCKKPASLSDIRCYRYAGYTAFILSVLGGGGAGHCPRVRHAYSANQELSRDSLSYLAIKVKQKDIFNFVTLL